VFFASLGWSVYLTSTDPLPAYFVTPTRVWELALGGLVALMFHGGAEPVHRRVRLLAGWLGLAMIGYAVVGFSSATAFPGLAALVPTAGTGLVLLANSDRLSGSPRALLSNRMSQYLGDLSYSIYLWHWPIVVLAPIALARTIFWPHKIALVLLTIVLAALTRLWVEDPFRRDPRLVTDLTRTFAVGAMCICVVLAGSAALGVALHRAAAATADLVTLRENSDCFGANATRSAVCNPAGEKLLTTPLFARDDQTDVQTDECRAKRPFTAHAVCTFGPRDAATKIALFGNSHAGHWQPAFVKVAEQESWQISTYLVNMCYPADAPISFGDPQVTENCQDWNAWAIRAINDGDFDLVVMSSRTVQPLVGVSHVVGRLPVIGPVIVVTGTARLLIRTSLRIRLRPGTTAVAHDFEFTGAAPVNPDRAVLIAPGLSPDAGRLRLLRDQPRVAAARGFTTGIPILMAFTQDSGAGLRRCSGRGDRGGSGDDSADDQSKGQLIFCHDGVRLFGTGPEFALSPALQQSASMQR